MGRCYARAREPRRTRRFPTAYHPADARARPDRSARRSARRRLLDGPRRAAVHDAPRPISARTCQGRAARGRRDARLGAAVGRRRRRRDADRGLLPVRQPQQALRSGSTCGRRPDETSCDGSCADADVLVENSRVGGFARLGLRRRGPRGAEPAARPSRDHAAAGMDGPDADKPGYDFVAQAIGGLMSITGDADATGGHAVKVGVAISDVVTGLFGDGRDPRRVCSRASAKGPRARASGSTSRCSNRPSPSW